MVWIGLLCVIVAVVFFLRSRYNEDEIEVPTVAVSATVAVAEVPEIIANSDEADELVAVIAAAIAELEGTSDFTVLSVLERHSSRWRTTARQEAVHNYL
ncbi:MAG: hypothetical protein E6713_04990 [Sporomusaceae bacterium]|nr:hypothetical protein [Sporomusaceae bacterium]